MKDDIKIFVVTHKETDYLPQDRTLIGVGNKVINEVSLYDNTGENISEKNKYFCELTALYWLWKNDNTSFVGLEHYRRFFCGKNIFKVKPLGIKKIIKLLEKYDCIVPARTVCNSSIYKHYDVYHDVKDLELCKSAIEKLCPEYLSDFNEVMSGNVMYNFNMFIMNRKLMEDYCRWMFEILFYIEKSVELELKDEYQKRVFGFLSERLFTVWLRREKLKVYECSVYMPNEIPIVKKIKRTLSRIKLRFKKH